MPWVPELFSAPALAQFEAKQQRRVEIIPYFDGLVAGEVDALVGSFVGEPRVQHPLRGLIEGEYEFREFVADTERWVRERGARVEDVHRGVLEHRGFEEVVVHLGGASGPVDLPHAMVADHGPESKIEEIRVYFSTRPLTGRATERAPLVAGDPELRLPSPVAAYLAEERERGVDLEPCVLVEDGDTFALEYNAHRPGTDAPVQAGLTVFERDADGGLASTRSYDDVDRRLEER
ncbi:MAG TPA: hypothetical protein VHS74_08260 [Solirubrobacterales bacterium]|jgi:hypothetical protein|nr:hypothetical protein [Solirubrobacterales bacterium]